uniref:Uncharacterized protein n=1 Tax=Oryza barthii TaxID=65489 RepID=A0A0D3GZ88_9ORYZ
MVNNKGMGGSVDDNDCADCACSAKGPTRFSDGGAGTETMKAGSRRRRHSWPPRAWRGPLTDGDLDVPRLRPLDLVTARRDGVRALWWQSSSEGKSHHHDGNGVMATERAQQGWGRSQQRMKSGQWRPRRVVKPTIDMAKWLSKFGQCTVRFGQVGKAVGDIFSPKLLNFGLESH